MDETLGERIKRLREVRRLSQPELAAALGVSTKTVSNWENNRNDPRSSLGALREFFGRSFDQGATGEDAAAGGGDEVEAAIRRSTLVRWRQNAVITEYERQLHEQRREEASG